MRGFFNLLSRTTAKAAELAARHDEKISADRAYLSVDADRPLRHALEVRHSTFETDDAIALAREHDIALVIADTAGKWPMFDVVTSDFMYVRLHGASELYVSGYTDAGLDHWAGKLRGWLDQGLDCYVYFDNDAKVRAPYDAMALIDRFPDRA
jgi:uncharacterized protein YecE (DUF72 family)